MNSTLTEGDKGPLILSGKFGKDSVFSLVFKSIPAVFLIAFGISSWRSTENQAWLISAVGAGLALIVFLFLGSGYKGEYYLYRNALEWKTKRRKQEFLLSEMESMQDGGGGMAFRIKGKQTRLLLLNPDKKDLYGAMWLFTNADENIPLACWIEFGKSLSQKSGDEDPEALRLFGPEGDMFDTGFLINLGTHSWFFPDGDPSAVNNSEVKLDSFSKARKQAAPGYKREPDLKKLPLKIFLKGIVHTSSLQEEEKKEKISQLAAFFEGSLLNAWNEAEKFFETDFPAEGTRVIVI